jgi:hypothetical protein
MLVLTSLGQSLQVFQKLDGSKINEEVFFFPYKVPNTILSITSSSYELTLQKYAGLTTQQRWPKIMRLVYPGFIPCAAFHIIYLEILNELKL